MLIESVNDVEVVPLPTLATAAETVTVSALVSVTLVEAVPLEVVICWVVVPSTAEPVVENVTPTPGTGWLKASFTVTVTVGLVPTVLVFPGLATIVEPAVWMATDVKVTSTVWVSGTPVALPEPKAVSVIVAV
jgi:hypothetical protein